MTTSSVRLRLGRFVASAAYLWLCATAQAQSVPIDRLVLFGASLTDSGNSFAWLGQPDNRGCGTRINVPPYDTLDDLAVPDGPYAVGGHHFTNGATWSESLARSLRLSGNARPVFASAGTKASNYAVGGARAVADYPCRVNLPAQVRKYLDASPQTSPGSWVGIEIGGNDVRDALVAASMGQDPAPYLQNALASVAEGVGMLYYYSGARRFFLMNVPDIGKTPAVRALGPAAVAGGAALSAAYNAGLMHLRQTLLGLPGSDVRIVDIHSTLNKIVAQPAAYGFDNAGDACVTPEVAPFRCTRPETYVFWDGIHPTHTVHAIIARQVLETITAP